ncbi:MAG: hypothetical protein L0211_03240 [Planctomycetaceae bacterium]|nr:hypothetical protein [Planctomycetaceae bacterium]
MNEHDQFAADLAALRPLPPSRELAERIAAELAELAKPVDTVEPLSLSQRRSHDPLWLAALCAPVAICLIYFLLRGVGERQQINMPESNTEAPIAAAFDESLPSLWSYRRAADKSLDQLDALLDKHATHSPEPKPQRAGAYAFALSDSELESLFGEL